MQTDNNSLLHYNCQFEMSSYQHHTVLPCSVGKCNNKARSLCHCCRKHYCYEHLNEHNESYNLYLRFLIGEIKKLDHQVNTMNIQQIIGNCGQEFEQWRLNCHLTVDRFFEEKYQELYRYVDEQIDRKNVEIRRLQAKVTELIRRQEGNDQELDAFRSTIADVQAELNNLDRLNHQINIQPLILDDSLINIKISTGQKVNLSILSPIYKTIDHPNGSYGTLATNNQFMLIHLPPSLMLIDKQFKIIEQLQWPYDKIWNMCWSPPLDRFVVIEKNNIHLVDDHTMAIENLQIIERRKWFACTSSDTSLFLSTDDRSLSIIEFDLKPSIRLVKEWKSPYTCRKDEYIDDMVYNKSTLALIITNKLEKSMRMELRLSETLERMWSFRLDISYDQNKPFRCCSINSKEWLLADYQRRRLLHVTKDGDLKTMITYNATPSHVALFGSSILAIARKNGINFHKL